MGYLSALSIKAGREHPEGRQAPWRRLPWIVAFASVTLFTTAGVLDLVVLSSGDSALESASFYILFTSFPLFGAFILTRMPPNRLGIVFLALGVVSAIGFFAQTYAQLGLVSQPGRWPLAEIGAWIEQWYWYSVIALLLVFLPLLFPDGAAPGRRWRIVGWIAGGALAVGSVGGMIENRLEGDGYSIDNPIGLAGVRDVESALGPVFLVLAVCCLLSLASLIQRYRIAGAEQRQQLKWFIFAVAFTIFSAIVGDIVDLPDALFSVTLMALLGGIGISVLKYRLYDIDVIINRALVYAALTTILLASYLGAVVLLSRVLDPVTRDSDIAVAASTLAVAALFRPLRTRIQGFIDRRFYRSKYDATAALARFATRLRDEVDIELVRSDVLGVVADTMQPRHASVWLRREGAEAR